MKGFCWSSIYDKRKYTYRECVVIFEGNVRRKQIHMDLLFAVPSLLSFNVPCIGRSSTETRMRTKTQSHT